MSLPVTIVREHRVVVGYEQITDVSAAVALKPKDAFFAVIQAETKNIRWRDDGVDPTATVGMLLKAGDTMEYDGDLNALRLIETEASAALNVAYYGK
jgi:hypothetical protein